MYFPTRSASIFVRARDPVEDPRPVHAALRHQEMEVRVEVEPVSEGLDRGNHTGDEFFACQGLKVDREGPGSGAAELPQEPTLELKEDPQYLGDRQHHLAMRHVQKKRFPHPRSPLFQTLGMARPAEAPCFAGERQQLFRMAVRAPDPGKARAGVAAVEITLDHLFDDRPEKTVHLLEATLVF